MVLDPYAAAAGNAEVQKAQRVALIDTLLKQYGQSREVGSVGSSPLLRRAARMFTGFTTRKNITKETIKKLITALRKAPIWNLLLFTVTTRAERSILPKTLSFFAHDNS